MFKDIFLTLGKTENIDYTMVEDSSDILNFRNLLNSDWSALEIPNSIQPLSVSVDGTNTPTYTFDGTLTETFSADVSLASRWQSQFGLRYIF